VAGGGVVNRRGVAGACVCKDIPNSQEKEETKQRKNKTE